MAFKSVTNSGISDADLKRGYTDTGATPEIGESVSSDEGNETVQHETAEGEMGHVGGDRC